MQGSPGIAISIPLDDGKTHAIWIRVTTGASAVAGVYTASVTLRFASPSGGRGPGNAPAVAVAPITVPLLVTVWGFTVPAPAVTSSKALNTIFSFEWASFVVCTHSAA